MFGRSTVEVQLRYSESSLSTFMIRYWCGIHCRCLQFLSINTGDAGNLVIILESTAACAFHRGPASLLTLTDFSLATVSVTTECQDSVLAFSGNTFSPGKCLPREMFLNEWCRWCTIKWKLLCLLHDHLTSPPQLAHHHKRTTLLTSKIWTGQWELWLAGESSV